MKIILLNKTCEYHKLLFAIELIFCNNAKSNGKKPIGFLSREPRATLTSGLAYKNTSSLHHSENYIECPMAWDGNLLGQSGCELSSGPACPWLRCGCVRCACACQGARCGRAGCRTSGRPSQGGQPYTRTPAVRCPPHAPPGTAPPPSPPLAQLGREVGVSQYIEK